MANHRNRRKMTVIYGAEITLQAKLVSTQATVFRENRVLDVLFRCVFYAKSR